jgi:Trk-type K+ transport system membrane component
MRNSERLVGVIKWISPDDTMAELIMADGQTKLITDVTIKQIKMSAFLFIFAVLFFLTITEKGKEITQILFETVSAFGSAGLSAGY